MKTILIIVSGLADLPEEISGGKTPLMLASTPALDALARCGCCGTLRVCPDGVYPTRENAILSLLGYDFRRGIPSPESLAKFGKTDSFLFDGEDLRYFIIPKFSGHGVVISTHPEVRGIGKMALLKPLWAPGYFPENVNMLKTLADQAIRSIEHREFVLLHVESAASMSRQGDRRGKQHAIERIDSDIIRPIADYVWNAKEQMNMVVVSDNIYPWSVGHPVEGEVPAVVYFNDDLPYDTPRFDERTVEEGPLNIPLPGDLIRMLISFEPVFDGV